MAELLVESNCSRCYRFERWPACLPACLLPFPPFPSQLSSQRPWQGRADDMAGIVALLLLFSALGHIHGQ